MSAALRSALGAAGLLLWLGAAAGEDVRRREIPLYLLLLGAAGGLLWQLTGAWADLRALQAAGSPEEAGFFACLWRQYRAYAAGLCCGAGLLAAGRISGGGIGRGDALLALALHGWLLPADLLGALTAAFLLCGLWGLGGILLRKKNGKDRLPFAPFLWLAVLVLLWGGGGPG